ncbi:MAG: GNAT family N-acetyltransferase [Acidobacteriota bacterium]
MKALELAVLDQNQYQRWFERHFDELNHRSPFHHPAWLNAAGRGVDFDVRFIGLFAGKDLIGAVPGFLTRRGPFRLFGSPLRGAMTSYLGPTTLARYTQAELVDLTESCGRFACKQWDVSYARFTLRDASTAATSKLAANWEEQQPKSYRLDLSPGISGLWDRLKSDCRRNIRKAKQQQIEILPLCDSHLFFQVLEQTFIRHRHASWQSEKFFQLIMTELTTPDLLWSWSARYQGKIIAVGLFLHDDREMHFISGASLPEHGSLPTSYLMHWHAIETAVNAGLRVYNSDASEVRSIDQFKESFRPSLSKRCSLVWGPRHVRYAFRFFMAARPHFQQMKTWLNRKVSRADMASTPQEFEHARSK